MTATTFLERLHGGSFVRNVFVVMSGTVVAQAIGLALSPVISRLFTPADYGVFGTFGAVTAVMATVATLDYSQAVMLPREREEAGQVFVLSCLVSLGVTCVCASLCILFPNWLLGLLSTSGAWVLPLLVLAVLAAGLNASLQAWCIRVKAFRRTSGSQIVRSVSSSGLQVGFGLAQAGAPGLVVSSVVAEFLACLNLLRLVRSELRGFIAVADWQRLRRLSLEYRDFPAYSASQNLLNALSNGLPVLLLTEFFGIAAGGAYVFGMRLLQAPMSIVSGALRQVLFQRASEMQHQGRPLYPLFVKTTAGLFALGVLPAVLLAVWSPALFGLVFGRQWLFAGELARYLVIWLLLAFCNLPAVLFARLIRIQRAIFFFNVFLLTGRAVVLVLGGYYLTAVQTVVLFSGVGAIMNCGLISLVGYALLTREKLLGGNGLRSGSVLSLVEK